MKIIVAEILNSSSAIFHNEGLEIYNHIENEIKNGKPVEISFEGLENCSTQFLNACIGKLYVTFPDKVLVSLLSFIYAPDIPWLEKKVQDVIENAIHSELHDQLLDNALAF